MPIDADIDAGYSGPGGGGYSGNPRGEASGFSGGSWNSVTEGGGNDRNGYRRRSGGRMKLPAEFAEFKLADGRTLREVLGDRFFGAGVGARGGKWMSKGVRERLLKNGRPDPGARAGTRRAERQARIDKWRAAHPGRGIPFGGGL